DALHDAADLARQVPHDALRVLYVDHEPYAGADANDLRLARRAPGLPALLLDRDGGLRTVNPWCLRRALPAQDRAGSGRRRRQAMTGGAGRAGRHTTAG